MLVDTPTRSRYKAVSWRVLATISTALLVYALTRRAGLALTVGVLDATIKIGLSLLHGRAWTLVKAGRREIRPAVLWFTGLSGSGKSTIGHRVCAALEGRGFRVEYLDGDTIRDIFPTTGFTKADRDVHIKRVGHLASTLERNGVFVVAAFISPYADTRTFVRELCNRFIEIFVSTPLEVCEQRDVKGLYAKARRGEITQFTSIDDPYEAPTSPELNVDTSSMSVDEAADKVMEYLGGGKRGQTPFSPHTDEKGV